MCTPSEMNCNLLSHIHLLPYTFTPINTFTFILYALAVEYMPQCKQLSHTHPDFMGYGFESIYLLNICVVGRLSFVVVPRVELFLFRSLPQLSWKPSAILNQFQYLIDKSCSSFHKTLATSQNLNSTFEGSTMKCQWAWSELSGSASFSPDLILAQTV